MRIPFIIVILTILLQSCGIPTSKKQSDASTIQSYSNEIYRFSVPVPEYLKLHSHIKNDTIRHRAIVAWGLPKIYSELEKTEIENAISITAYHRKDISSVDNLILSEYLRINPIETALEVDTSSVNTRMIYTTTSTGLQYKGKSYFIFKNEIGYIVTFMATPGTYQKNIKVFEEFYQSINFL